MTVSDLNVNETTCLLFLLTMRLTTNIKFSASLWHVIAFLLDLLKIACFLSKMGQHRVIYVCENLFCTIQSYLKE